MGTDEKAIRERIVIATIECIEVEGLPGLTVRKIAQRARVNVAAINYYFGNKVKLIDIALHQTLDEAFVNMIKEELNVANRTPREALKAFFKTMLEGELRYPGITKAHLFKPLMQNEYRTIFVERANRFLRDLTDRVAVFFPDQERREIQLGLIQIIAALMFIGLMPQLFKSSVGLDFTDAADRDAYIDLLIQRYFGSYPQEG